MFYIRVANKADAQKVINTLEEKGFTNSMWSANIKDCKGIATYINPL